MIIYKTSIIHHIFKCAGTSVGFKLKKEDPFNISYFTGHDSVKILKSDFFDYAKEYKHFALVRNPLTFYESFYNYVSEFPPKQSLNHDVITRELMFDEEGKQYSLSEYVKRCMDLGKTLNGKHLENIKRKFKNAQGYYNTWIPDIDNFQFPNISFYQWTVENILNDDCITFQMETEIDSFLEAIGSTKGLPKKNVTGEKHKKERTFTKRKCSNEDLNIIREIDEPLFKRFGY